MTRRNLPSYVKLVDVPMKLCDLIAELQRFALNHGGGWPVYIEGADSFETLSAVLYSSGTHDAGPCVVLSAIGH